MQIERDGVVLRDCNRCFCQYLMPGLKACLECEHVHWIPACKPEGADWKKCEDCGVRHTVARCPKQDGVA